MCIEAITADFMITIPTQVIFDTKEKTYKLNEFMLSKCLCENLLCIPPFFSPKILFCRFIFLFLALTFKCSSPFMPFGILSQVILRLPVFLKMMGDFLLLTETPLNLRFLDLSFVLPIVLEFFDESELEMDLVLVIFDFFLLFLGDEDDPHDEVEMCLFLFDDCLFALLFEPILAKLSEFVELDSEKGFFFFFLGLNVSIVDEDPLDEVEIRLFLFNNFFFALRFDSYLVTFSEIVEEDSEIGFFFFFLELMVSIIEDDPLDEVELRNFFFVSLFFTLVPDLVNFSEFVEELDSDIGLVLFFLDVVLLFTGDDSLEELKVLLFFCNISFRFRVCFSPLENLYESGISSYLCRLFSS